MTIDQTIDQEQPAPGGENEAEKAEEKITTMPGQIIEMGQEEMSGTDQPLSEENATNAEIDEGPMVPYPGKVAQFAKQRTDDILLGTGTQIRSNRLEFVIGEEEVFRTLTAGGTR